MPDAVTDQAPNRQAPNRLRRVLVAAAGAAAAASALYLILQPAGNASRSGGLARLAAAAKGELAAVQVRGSALPLPELAFADAEGKMLTLADFRGRTVLLNLWATWCAPCKAEMPALDKLQARYGGADFEVVTVNIDTRDPERAARFLDEIGVRMLKRYADTSAAIFQTLKRAGKATGMPTTLLIDRDGREIANLAGPAEWASEDAFAFIEAALALAGGRKAALSGR
jgi:thiol-disulfide isomerase/thioredoxin